MPDRFVFAHLADAHVGAWPRAPKVRAALRESVLRALAVVEERSAEFLLISGDLFHTPVPDPTEVAPVAAALKRLVDQGRRVYAIYGSHDYVAHRTSWLDVLAAAGVFVKVAPEAVRTEGTRWTLPFLIDPATGARIAGISGRSHGLDREYFRAVDSEAFSAEPGFKIFQFHAAVEEYFRRDSRSTSEASAARTFRRPATTTREGISTTPTRARAPVAGSSSTRARCSGRAGPTSRTRSPVAPTRGSRS